MTDQVICSGCGETIPWPTGGVRTNAEWLTANGKARRVTMVDLQSGEEFHQCR